MQDDAMSNGRFFNVVLLWGRLTFSPGSNTSSIVLSSEEVLEILHRGTV